MSKYKVTLVLELNEGHPRKWLSEAIWENLNDGEDILEIDYEELDVNED
jgi:hypothetical protein